MPNWTINKLTLEKNDFERVKGKILNKDGEVDFNRLVRMPKSLAENDAGMTEHSIYAYLLTQGTKAAARKELLRLFPGGSLISPTPVTERVEEWFKHWPEKETDPTFIAKGKNFYENHQKYGYFDWYNWSCDKWGTKWNASDSEVIENDDNVIIYFSTAWCPPTGWLSKLAEICDFAFIAADEDLGSGVYDLEAEGGQLFGNCPDFGSERNKEIVAGLWGWPEDWDDEEEETA